MKNTEKKLFLYIVTYTEDDKELHEYAVKNWLSSLPDYNEVNNLKIRYSKLSSPYRIRVEVEVPNSKIDVWNFVVFVPTHQKGSANPWELQEDWKNALLIQMKNNLSFAATIRDEKSKYIIMNENEFDSISALPFSGYEGKDFYPTVISKAAIILYTIVKNHPFYDGNKRTALLTCISFLNSCGFDFLKLNRVEIVERVKDFMVFVANSRAEAKEEVMIEIKEFILKNVIINLGYQVWMSEKYKLESISDLIEFIE